MRQPPTSFVKVPANDPKALRLLRWTLLLLVLELTFEGLARKLNFGGTKTLIFVMKDVIVAAMGVQILRLKRPQAIDFLWIAYLLEIVLFLPLILETAAHDPILAIFGAKEYLLYPIVAFGVFIGFSESSTEEVVRYFRWMALLVIPTALIALLQLRLPTDHWLNLSVDGDSLEGFSAGGHLRVSSTFSFVAQYCAFIDAEVFMTMIALNSLKDVKWIYKLVFLSIVPLLVVSGYVTGSRGAVLGCLLIVILGSSLCVLRFKARNSLRVIFIIGGLLATIFVSRLVFPAAFEGYAEREQGQILGASSEIQQRIYGSMFDWMNNIGTTPALGYGLGIMSNGSELLSHYATVTREYSWTETDFATTLFEGGIYLVVIWYAFRYFVIFQAVRHFFMLKREDLALPCGFCVGFVIILGLTGTLAIQPPIAIWWWLSVGTTLVIWKKSTDPVTGSVPDELPPPATKPKLRGRSAYAEQLHTQEK